MMGARAQRSLVNIGTYHPQIFLKLYWSQRSKILVYSFRDHFEIISTLWTPVIRLLGSVLDFILTASNSPQ